MACTDLCVEVHGSGADFGHHHSRRWRGDGDLCMEQRQLLLTGDVLVKGCRVVAMHTVPVGNHTKPWITRGRCVSSGDPPLHTSRVDCVDGHAEVAHTAS